MRIPFFKKKPKKQQYTVAFYNVENLFDPRRNSKILDSDYTPNGVKKWTLERYQRKLRKLAKTMVNIGDDGHPYPPAILGLAEAENNQVLKDLVDTDPLDDLGYGFVHFDSPDERGIDTALIYRKKFFKVLHAEPLALLVDNAGGIRDTTRDILYIKGEFNNELMHIFINHWPSRREGDVATAYKRIAAAEEIIARMEIIKQTEQEPNVIVMGDFNDDPSSESVQVLKNKGGLFNPMESLHIPNSQGSSIYNMKWNLFDQILISSSFFNYEKGTHSFDNAGIYNHKSLMEKKGKFKGTPYRTFVSHKYMGGYSDHFPVYAMFTFNT
ncbi:Endonuclease/Exonuclease/phosphatase family protein [Maribacter sedimenticola]|uniref:Endonuclease/Exonuclease/phosphatase family protein n=1 Tax=Maribacter sedimenticola TaxID=228956 RepID=A0ABY1SCU5_9FLAO|nr:endonuclease/exonuclease/phosphatase family protein [Maribacter sedimenticola]SNR25556.1 Endonuclease/Exonuclease/phosphatase family protein [Maribacter sedimenticola]